MHSQIFCVVLTDVPEVDSCYENIYLEDHILVDKLSALNLDTHTLPGKCIYKITSRRERFVYNP